MIRLLNHNIWGNYGKTGAVANRAGLILDIIKETAPDIITFQECNPRTFRAEAPSLIDRMSDVYAEAAQENAHKNFTPAFYRRDRFTLIESGFHPYAGLNDGNSKSITYAVLEDKTTGKMLAIAGTHFWYKATGEVDEEQRRENARVAARICRELVAKYNVPVIVAGDLNSCDKNGQGLGGYDEMVKQGFTDVRYTAKRTTDCETAHDYPPRGKEGSYLPGDNPNETLDYIFTMGEVKAESFTVLTDDKALASSDHCPLVAEFDM